MTWAQWIESNYNPVSPNNFWIYSGNKVMAPGPWQAVSLDGSSYVYGTSSIIPNTAYVTFNDE